MNSNDDQKRRATLVATIRRLSAHLADTVVDQLVDEIEAEEKESRSPLIGDSIETGRGLLPPLAVIDSGDELEDSEYSDFHGDGSDFSEDLTLGDLSDDGSSSDDSEETEEEDEQLIDHDAERSSGPSGCGQIASESSGETLTANEYLAGDESSYSSDEDTSSYSDAFDYCLQLEAGSSKYAFNASVVRYENDSEALKLGQTRLKRSLSRHRSFESGDTSGTGSITKASNHTSKSDATTRCSTVVSGMTQVQYTEYKGAVCFVDISGFTVLSRSLGVERLSKVRL